MPKKKKKSEATIEYEYTVADDFRVIYANGAFGGPNPSGEVRFDFWYEHRTFPKTARFKLTEGVRAEEVSRTPSKPKLIRERKIGIVLLPEHAKSIGEFLIEQSKFILEAREKAK